MEHVAVRRCDAEALLHPEGAREPVDRAPDILVIDVREDPSLCRRHPFHVSTVSALW